MRCPTFIGAPILIGGIPCYPPCNEVSSDSTLDTSKISQEEIKVCITYLGSTPRPIDGLQTFSNKASIYSQ